MQSQPKNKEKLMQEALDLQSQWEQALFEITQGRQFDELTPAEQDEWKRISIVYNNQIDKKLHNWERSSS